MDLPPGKLSKDFTTLFVLGLPTADGSYALNIHLLFLAQNPEKKELAGIGDHLTQG